MFPTYWLLVQNPYLFAFLFYMFVMGTMFMQRKEHQKLAFQVSHSAFFGFAAVCVTFGMAGECLRSAEYVALLPPFVQTWWFHLGCLVGGGVVGYTFQSFSHPGPMKDWRKNTEKADLIYALSLLPLTVYLWLITANVIFREGNLWMMVNSGLLYLYFLKTLWYDWKHKLLDQTKVVRETKITSVLDQYLKG